jgi:hypothetical protein
MAGGGVNHVPLLFFWSQADQMAGMADFHSAQQGASRFRGRWSENGAGNENNIGRLTRVRME